MKNAGISILPISAYNVNEGVSLLYTKNSARIFFRFMFKMPCSAAKIFLKDRLATDGNKAKGIFER